MAETKLKSIICVECGNLIEYLKTEPENPCPRCRILGRLDRARHQEAMLGQCRVVGSQELKLKLMNENAHIGLDTGKLKSPVWFKF